MGCPNKLCAKRCLIPFGQEGLSPCKSSPSFFPIQSNLLRSQFFARLIKAICCTNSSFRVSCVKSSQGLIVSSDTASQQYANNSKSSFVMLIACSLKLIKIAAGDNQELGRCNKRHAV